MAVNLEELEDFVREKIVKEKWTHAKLSSYLQQRYPGVKGFSIRTLERFCANNCIHKTAKIGTVQLDEAVETAIDKVVGH